MKKLSFLLLLVFLVGCGSSKVVRQSKKEIKGNWVLNSVNYDKTGTYAITFLNDASKACFEQSTWSFVPNNNTGIYSIANANCATGDRYFNFTIQEVDANTGLYHFLLKPTDEKGKSPDNAGFRLRLSQLSENTMQWQQTVSVDGSPFTINMNFTKL
ncbi:lipocalin family protein [Bizionia paragorgiae]|uniref:lipocalin family protein n=1 Tax=Bizionia paragorgiae TaxID=283786 RepID=UPI00299E4334|nr:lipocalin family protein [Bizionia paragorgiae]MDX1272175.1 lipocalin family protein [Bizionia paragorgiae]